MIRVEYVTRGWTRNIQRMYAEVRAEVELERDDGPAGRF